ncbi:MAG: hypothetical protein LQ339_008264 [Xanthoria mediterranea]|nr:MAG: hypothetical protein LQ339_008264 [Xanthoria mediterranea]
MQPAIAIAKGKAQTLNTMGNILKTIFLCAMLLPSLSIGAPNPLGATLDITIHTSSDQDQVAGGQHQHAQSINDMNVAKWALMKQGDGADGAFDAFHQIPFPPYEPEKKNPPPSSSINSNN